MTLTDPSAFVPGWCSLASERVHPPTVVGLSLNIEPTVKTVDKEKAQSHQQGGQKKLLETWFERKMHYLVWVTNHILIMKKMRSTRCELFFFLFASARLGVLLQGSSSFPS
jgi:hypothetical protein